MAWYNTTINAVKSLFGFAPTDLGTKPVKLSPCADEVLALAMVYDCQKLRLTSKDLAMASDLKAISTAKVVAPQKLDIVKQLAIKRLEELEHPSDGFVDYILAMYPDANVDLVDGKYEVML